MGRSRALAGHAIVPLAKPFGESRVSDPTGEGASRNTRGRVCSPDWTEPSRLNGSLRILMSKRANPATIGIFISVGLALGVGAVLLFSSARFFTKTEKYILYFDGSVLGLNPGAPVKFRGVTVGSVRDILIHHN